MNQLINGQLIPIAGASLGGLAGTILGPAGTVGGFAAGYGAGDVIRRGIADLTHTGNKDLYTISNPAPDVETSLYSNFHGPIEAAKAAFLPASLMYAAGMYPQIMGNGVQEMPQVMTNEVQNTSSNTQDTFKKLVNQGNVDQAGAYAQALPNDDPLKQPMLRILDSAIRQGNKAPDLALITQKLSMKLPLTEAEQLFMKHNMNLEQINEASAGFAPGTRVQQDYQTIMQSLKDNPIPGFQKGSTNLFDFSSTMPESPISPPVSTPVSPTTPQPIIPLGNQQSNSSAGGMELLDTFNQLFPHKTDINASASLTDVFKKIMDSPSNSPLASYKEQVANMFMGQRPFSPLGPNAETMIRNKALGY